MTRLSQDRRHHDRRAQKLRHYSIRDTLRLELELLANWFRMVSARGLETLLKYGIRPGSEVIDLPPDDYRDRPQRREPPASRSTDVTPSATWRSVRGKPLRYQSTFAAGAEKDD